MYRSSRRSHLLLRRAAVPIAVTCVLAALLVFLGNSLLHHSLNEAIRSDSQKRAVTWVHEVAQRTPMLADYARGELEQAPDMQDVMASGAANNIVAFKLFNTDGVLVLSQGLSDISRDGEAGDYSATALNVIETSQNDVSLVQTNTGKGPANVYAEAYVVARSADGSIFGVIEVYIDATEIDLALHDVFQRLAGILIIGSALAYWVPSLFFVFRNEQLRQSDQALRKLSTFDPLTNTLNRRSFSRQTTAIFEDRTSENIGVIFFDLDRFKDVNDVLGHEFGDALLKHTARTASAQLNEDAIIGRFGGDEFIIVQKGIEQREMLQLCNRIHNALSGPFTHKGNTITVELGIGAHLSSPGEDADWAQHAANLALHSAKANGPDQIVEFYPELEESLRRRRHVEASMRRALAGEGGFYMDFQPIFRSCGVRIAGFEALMRLRDADGQLISPGEFIPIAEESGMINQIGQMSLECTFETAKLWPRDVYLAVNLSAIQFKDGKLVEVVRSLLEKTGFAAQRLELEVTESLLLDEDGSVSRQLSGLKDLGASIALDDFGTGYSSLGYLWKFPFDKLKIDRVFLQGFDLHSDKYREVIATILMLGQNLGIRVTAEGVESDVQLRMLQELGCDQFQGFLLGRPMAASAARDLALAHENTAAKSA